MLLRLRLLIISGSVLLEDFPLNPKDVSSFAETLAGGYGPDAKAVKLGSCSGMHLSAQAGLAALRMPGYARQMLKQSTTGSGSSPTSSKDTTSPKHPSSTWMRQDSCLDRAVLSESLFLKAILHLVSRHSQEIGRVQQLSSALGVVARFCHHSSSPGARFTLLGNSSVWKTSQLHGIF